MFDLKNKKILIYGYGLSGKSCFNYLNKKNILSVFDDNLFKIPNKIKTKTINIKKINQRKFDFIVMSPGIDINQCKLKNFLKKNYNKIITDFDIFYFLNPRNKLITITGTNGKSTTAKLIYDILKQNKIDVRLVGNIGKPILDEKKIRGKTVFIVEASSYQIQYSKYFKTDIAVFLNISPDHLERHKTFSNYFNTKFKIIQNQKRNGISFIPKNCKIIDQAIKKNNVNTKICRVQINSYEKILKNIKNKYFSNVNNLENLIFAIEIAIKLKCSKKNILKAINFFKPLPFRNQIIYNSSKITIINDSKSTSFSSSINLLKSYKNIYWLIGGIAKKNDRFNLQSKFYKNIRAYIFGKDRIFFSKQLNNKIKFKRSKKLFNIIKKIIIDVKKDNSKPNIIFSPAAASFDQFKNFEERGRYFNKIIKRTNYLKYAK